jgi:hypothetical protein
MSKILILFKPIGNAHILKISKYQVNSNYTVKQTRIFLQKKLSHFSSLELQIRTSQRNIYYPQDTETIEKLHQRFSFQNILIIWYSYYDNGDEMKSQYCPQCYYQKCDCGFIISKDAYNNIDNILLNMKIITNIEKGDKIIFHNNHFLIDKPDWYQGIKRWWQGTNRIQSINFLIEFYRKIIIFRKYIIDNNDKFKNDIRIDIFIDYFTNIKTPLLNIKETYNDDELILSIISNILNEFDKIE